MLFFATVSLWSGTDLHLNQNDALETHGLSVLLFHNQYHKVFGDQKMSGLEIILHDQRVATNGDVRLSATPAQWDPIRHVEGRKRGPLADEITALCRYPDRGLKYRIDVRPEPGGFRIAVQLDEPMLVDLAGKAALNLEFVPDLYFGKSFVTGATAGIFPRHSDGPMERTSDGSLEPAPLAKGDSMVLSPEDPLTRVSINSETGPILLYDGRNQAQNGWFVVRTLLPTGKTVDVIVCHIKVKVGPGWTRSPVIGYNQVGYTPEREKVVIIEPDPLFNAPMAARVLRLTPEGDWREERLLGFRGRNTVEVDRVRQQSGRLHLHSRRTDSGSHHYSARLPGTERWVAISVERKRVCCGRGHVFHSCRERSTCRNKIQQMNE